MRPIPSVPKCQDLDITRIVVDMKAEIEKIREQIQNLE